MENVLSREFMTTLEQRTVETHGRASLQSGIIRHFLRCPNIVMQSNLFLLLFKIFFTNLHSYSTSIKIQPDLVHPRQV